MVEPALALQTAVRAALVSAPAVTALVLPDQIRAGSTRPERFPAIILNASRTEFLGRAAGGQMVARVLCNLHVWAIEDGAELAQAIGFAVAQTLFDKPTPEGFEIDEYTRPAFVWLRDPQPERAYTHGAAQIEAVLRWRP